MAALIIERLLEDEESLDWTPDPTDPDDSTSNVRDLATEIFVLGLVRNNFLNGVSAKGYPGFDVKIDDSSFLSIQQAERVIGNYLKRVPKSEPALNWRYCYDNGGIIAEIWHRKPSSEAGDFGDYQRVKRLQYTEGKGFNWELPETK